MHREFHRVPQGDIGVDRGPDGLNVLGRARGDAVDIHRSSIGTLWIFIVPSSATCGHSHSYWSNPYLGKLRRFLPRLFVQK
jgi:hypothetical protein